MGQVGGTIGETCAIALIIGGIYLLYKHVISWKIPCNLHRNRIHFVRSNRQTRHAYARTGNLRRRCYAGRYLHGN